MSICFDIFFLISVFVDYVSLNVFFYACTWVNCMQILVTTLTTLYSQKSIILKLYH